MNIKSIKSILSRNLNQLKNGLFLVSIIFTVYIVSQTALAYDNQLRFWNIQSIDTMKYSRDLAREKLKDKKFDTAIDDQVRLIAEIGATHVAINTPYDNEFLPFLKKWVIAARKYHLKVWFRGNWSGWEGWFDYPEITRQDHIVKTREFILNNPDLFENGDVFTACPECENGGPGDPRLNNDIYGHRQFLIQENQTMGQSFKAIGKSVIYNYDAMNGDVARLIMDHETTKALGGVVTIDHYVETPDILISDINKFVYQSRGRIVLGEFGAPILDITGSMTPAQQAKWVEDALIGIAKSQNVDAINYWVNTGGTTQLWDDNLKPLPVVDIIKNMFNPFIISGFVKDEDGDPIFGVKVSNEYASTSSKLNGYFSLPYYKYTSSKLDFSKSNFYNQSTIISSDQPLPINIVLRSNDLSGSLLSRVWLSIKSLISIINFF